ncbi:Hypothetical protein SSCIU_00293 [Mammaliicoccus sciuri]|nr:Hypothetical protein SSCIU_00293 [Mammaliicoccus sciuri]
MLLNVSCSLQLFIPNDQMK